MLVKHTVQRVEDDQDDEKIDLIETTNYSFKAGEDLQVSATLKMKNPTKAIREIGKKIEHFLAQAVRDSESPTQENLPLGEVDAETGEIRKVSRG